MSKRQAYETPVLAVVALTASDVVRVSDNTTNEDMDTLFGTSID